MRILWSICNTATIFLKISQNSHKTPVPGSYFDKVLASSLIFIKKTSTQVFPSYFWKLSSNTLFHNTSGQLTLPTFNQYAEFADLTKCRIFGITELQETSSFRNIASKNLVKNHIVWKKYVILCLVFFK